MARIANPRQHVKKSWRRFIIGAETVNHKSPMECRPGCGACCIAISMSSPIPGMPGGKPAGVRCIHLLGDYRCALFGDPSRPKVCSDFRAEPEFCGNNREEALKILRLLDDR